MAKTAAIRWTRGVLRKEWTIRQRPHPALQAFYAIHQPHGRQQNLLQLSFFHIPFKVRHQPRGKLQSLLSNPEWSSNGEAYFGPCSSSFFKTNPRTYVETNITANDKTIFESLPSSYTKFNSKTIVASYTTTHAGANSQYDPSAYSASFS